MNNRVIAVSLLFFVLSLPMLSQRPIDNVTKVNVDSFRGFPWGSSEDKIRENYPANAIGRVEQTRHTYMLSVPDESMFGLKGDLWFELTDGELTRGIWEFPANSRRRYWIGRHVARRDVTTVLSMLEEKYGSPAHYTINGTSRNYVSRENVYDDFGAADYPVNNVDIWWFDAKGNGISLHLQAEREFISISYHSIAAMQQALKREDH